MTVFTNFNVFTETGSTAVSDCVAVAQIGDLTAQATVWFELMKLTVDQQYIKAAQFRKVAALPT